MSHWHIPVCIKTERAHQRWVSEPSLSAVAHVHVSFVATIRGYSSLRHQHRSRKTGDDMICPTRGKDGTVLCDKRDRGDKSSLIPGILQQAFLYFVSLNLTTPAASVSRLTFAICTARNRAERRPWRTYDCRVAKEYYHHCDSCSQPPTTKSTVQCHIQFSQPFLRGIRVSPIRWFVGWGMWVAAAASLLSPRYDIFRQQVSLVSLVTLAASLT